MMSAIRCPGARRLGSTVTPTWEGVNPAVRSSLTQAVTNQRDLNKRREGFTRGVGSDVQKLLGRDRAVCLDLKGERQRADGNRLRRREHARHGEHHEGDQEPAQLLTGPKADHTPS